ncbi:sensor histidine kinase [Paenibacillaceae bacterium]|nr:sensor histidine kinase [Paenibacillaceae bacterium]
MKNNIFQRLDAKKSIRVQILWAVFLSLVLAACFTWLVSSFLGWFRFFKPMFYIPPILFITSFFTSFLFFTRNIMRYMRTLAEGLLRIADGNFHHRVPLSRSDELGTIGKSINHMALQTQQHIERERQAEQSKLELITGLSHDIRTPLTSVVGYLNLIKSEAYQSADEQRQFIHSAYQKTMQLNGLIDDLFEYTRLIDQDVRMTMKEVELRHLLGQIVYEFEPLAVEQGLRVSKQWPAERITVLTDSEKLMRAIDNLLMNALKYSLRPGEIKVRLYAEGEHVCLEIENRGGPITAEAEKRLFERFYKADQSRERNQADSGSGLGLSIAKTIVELHGGQLYLKHNEGQFVFVIILQLVNAK